MPGGRFTGSLEQEAGGLHSYSGGEKISCLYGESNLDSSVVQAVV